MMITRIPIALTEIMSGKLLYHLLLDMKIGVPDPL